MRIKLSEERRADLAAAIHRFFAAEFGEDRPEVVGRLLKALSRFDDGVPYEGPTLEISPEQKLRQLGYLD